jgi:cytochrome P450
MEYLPEFEPESKLFRENPYPVYNYFQKFAPVYYREKHNDWIITKYDDVKHCLENPLLWPEPMEKPFTSVNLEWHEILNISSDSQKILMMQNKIQDINNHFFSSISAPYHTHIRKIMNPLFLAKKMELLRSKLQNISDSLLESKVKVGEIDVLSDYAFPFSTTILFEMLGLPLVDIEKLMNLAKVCFSSHDIYIDKEKAGLKRKMALLSMVNYLNPILKEHRKNLKDDILSYLLIAEKEGQLTNDAVFSIIMTLIIAGAENTINSIVLAIHCLINNHKQRIKLQDEPALIKSAIEELLRFTSTVQCRTLTARNPLKIRDKIIKKGQQLNLIIGAANHDSEKFDNPDKLDITRHPNPHLTFSSGAHYCIGTVLARLEMEIAITTLFKHFPNIRLAEPFPELTDVYYIRSFKQLKVYF